MKKVKEEDLVVGNTYYFSQRVENGSYGIFIKIENNRVFFEPIENPSEYRVKDGLTSFEESDYVYLEHPNSHISLKEKYRLALLQLQEYSPNDLIIVGNVRLNIEEELENLNK